MRQRYEEWTPDPETKGFLDRVNEIVRRYQAQGLKLSVRQVYYQLVAHYGLPNTEKSYAKTQRIINMGRLGGYIDWDAIEDRNREIESRPRWGSGAEIIDICARSFHMDMWQHQHNRLFVIIEKAALAGVLESVCREWDVPLLAARGYPSVSIVREMALEHVVPAIEAGQEVTILHLGDHDPSGIDMTRDLDDRFEMFIYGEFSDISCFNLRRIALTMNQIDEQNPPPNPAKITDSRFREYSLRYGDESWELDALDPVYLRELVTRHIVEYVDDALWHERREEIDAVRAELDKVAVRFAKKGI
jgi:hypothetical protein